MRTTSPLTSETQVRRSSLDKEYAGCARKCRRARGLNKTTDMTGGNMNGIQRISTLLLMVFILVPAVHGQTTAQVKPASPHDFVIMAWGSSPSDPEQLAGMKEAGLNVSGFCRPEDLDE